MNRSVLNGSIWPVAVLAALICLAVFARAYHCDFVNWDDQNYVSNNTAIRTLDWNFFRWAFTEAYLGWWMPLTWFSFAVDYAMWGLNPAGYHLTNILLHAANTGLVVLIAGSLFREHLDSGRGGLLYPGILLLAGLAWGIHPMRVESVAWVTERKDVLNGLFALLSLLFYLNYTKNREAFTGGNRLCYFLSIIFFALSLMAKSVSVVMPVVLLVLDWYPLRRLTSSCWRKILVEKLPYAILSLAMITVTLSLAMQHKIVVSGLSLSQRAQISGNAIFEYVRLFFLPVDIIPLYIITDPIPPAFLIKSVVVLVAIIFMLLIRKKFPGITATMLLFLLPLLPTLAFTQNGIQSMAMRFTYLPSLAVVLSLSLLLCRSMPGLEKTATRNMVAAVFLGCFLLLGAYGVATIRQIGVWKDSAAMWTRVIEYQPFDRAFFYRGLHYSDKGNFEAAIADYSTTLAIFQKEGMPGGSNILAFRGEAFAGAGRYREAVADLSAAIESSPQPLYYYHRSLAFRKLGMTAEADADLTKAGNASGKMQWF